MKIYGEVPAYFFGDINDHLSTDGDVRELSELDEIIDAMIKDAQWCGHAEALRQAYAHLLSKPDFDLDSFFHIGIWRDDEKLRQILEYTYRRAWPDADWPLKWEDYQHVELIRSPGPTWAAPSNRWGPDAPPSRKELKNGVKR